MSEKIHVYGGQIDGSKPITPATFEQITIPATESFLWRLDDYPMERHVWNFHPEAEIHLIRKTSGIAFVGDHIGEFGPGYLAMAGSGLPHDWVTPAANPGELTKERDIVLQFSEASVIAGTRHMPELSGLTEFFQRAARGIQFFGETRARGEVLLEEMANVRGIRRLAMFFELLAILSESEEYAILSSDGFMPTTDASDMDKLQRILLHIRRHSNEDILQTDVADLAGMTASAFSRFFLKNTGNTFTDHVKELRLAHACRLLAQTDIPVTDICFEIGYNNISNFNRNFLSRHGITPSNYRRLAAKRRTVAAEIA